MTDRRKELRPAMLRILTALLTCATALHAAAPLVDVFVAGADGYACFRIPALLALPNGTLLLYAEGRNGTCADHGDVHIVQKASHDGGATWGSLMLVRSETTPASRVTIGNPAPVSLGGATVLLPFCRDNLEAAVLLSEDGGSTYTLLSNITWPGHSWTWVATGPPGSLQLPSGRIVVPSNHVAQGDKAPSSHAFLSDDGGHSWSLSTFVPAGDEDQAVALPWLGPQALLLSMRSSPKRLAASSADGGATWSAPWQTITETSCEASTIALPAHPAGPLLVMSSAFSSARQNMSLHTSADAGHTWTPAVSIYAGNAAYSSLIAVGDDTVALVFERDGYHALSFIGGIRV